MNLASGYGLRWWMDLTPTLSPSETVSANLRMILRGLLAALGMWRVRPGLAPMLYNRISATFGRIERMLVRFRAGRLWQVTHRVTAPRRQMCRKPEMAIPRRFGWLVQAGGHQATGFGVQLQTELNTPEMVALLAASPQARRILRPLCRALAVEVPGVCEPVRRTPTTRRIRKPRPKPEPFKIPLPRGVLSAARRAGFGKLR